MDARRTMRRPGAASCCTTELDASVPDGDVKPAVDVAPLTMSRLRVRLFGTSFGESSLGRLQPSMARRCALQAAVLPVDLASLGVASPSGVNRLQLQTRLVLWSSACSC